MSQEVEHVKAINPKKEQAKMHVSMAAFPTERNENADEFQTTDDEYQEGIKPYVARMVPIRVRLVHVTHDVWKISTDELEECSLVAHCGMC